MEVLDSLARESKSVLGMERTSEDKARVECGIGLCVRLYVVSVFWRGRLEPTMDQWLECGSC